VKRQRKDLAHHFTDDNSNELCVALQAAFRDARGIGVKLLACTSVSTCLANAVEMQVTLMRIPKLRGFMRARASYWLAEKGRLLEAQLLLADVPCLLDLLPKTPRVKCKSSTGSNDNLKEGKGSSATKTHIAAPTNSSERTVAAKDFDHKQEKHEQPTVQPLLRDRHSNTPHKKWGDAWVTVFEACTHHSKLEDLFELVSGQGILVTVHCHATRSLFPTNLVL
jgi:hypothetical protein